jgi:hypothetical protein
MERVLPVVESPCHFVEVGCKVFRADFMPPAHDSALQQRECGLYAVRMEVANDVLQHARCLGIGDYDVELEPMLFA